MKDRSGILNHLPNREKRYLIDTASIVENEFRDNLLGIYLVGSASYNEYVTGESDLDLQVVCKSEMNEKTLRDLTHKLLHINHPCPATKLELVVYTRESLLSENNIEYSLNLNTGCTISDHVSFDPNEDPAHWFVLDIAMGRSNAISLYGKEPHVVFPAISDYSVAHAMLDCLKWYNINLPLSVAHSFCICRCYAYISIGRLVSKKQAKALVEEKLGLKDLNNESDMVTLQESVIKSLRTFSA